MLKPPFVMLQPPFLMLQPPILMLKPPFVMYKPSFLMVCVSTTPQKPVMTFYTLTQGVGPVGSRKRARKQFGGTV
jgi:hypothetical protein